MDLLNIKADLKSILDELNNEMKTIDKIRKSEYLSDKLKGGNRHAVGFNEHEDEELDEPDSERRSPRNNNHIKRSSI